MRKSLLLQGRTWAAQLYAFLLRCKWAHVFSGSMPTLRCRSSKWGCVARVNKPRRACTFAGSWWSCRAGGAPSLTHTGRSSRGLWELLIVWCVVLVWSLPVMLVGRRVVWRLRCVEWPSVSGVDSGPSSMSLPLLVMAVEHRVKLRLQADELWSASAVVGGAASSMSLPSFEPGLARHDRPACLPEYGRGPSRVRVGTRPSRPRASCRAEPAGRRVVVCVRCRWWRCVANLVAVGRGRLRRVWLNMVVSHAVISMVGGRRSRKCGCSSVIRRRRSCAAASGPP